MVRVILCSLALVLLWEKSATAGPASFTYEGVLTDANDQPVKGLTLPVRLDVIGHSNGADCPLAKDVRSIAFTNGSFAIRFGANAGSLTVYSGGSVLDLYGSQSIGGDANDDGTVDCTFNPLASDAQRFLKVTVDGQTFDKLVISSAPMSMVADRALTSGTIGSTKESELLRLAAGGTASPLSSTEYAEFLALLNGTSSKYLHTGTSTDWSAITNKPIAATTPSNGQILKWNGTSSLWEPANESAGGGMAQATSSSSGYLSSTDWTTFNGKQNALGYSPVNKAGDTMTGGLSLPANGLIVGTDQLLVAAGGNVGVGTTVPNDKLDVAGKIRATHLCASDGSNCKDLTTSWGSGGTVTSVSGGTGLTGTVTTTGSISLATIANNTLLANTSGSTAVPVATGLSALIDSTLAGAAQGNILYRGASGWSVLAPGTSGQFLKTQGAGASPVWSGEAYTGTVTSVALSVPSMFSVEGSPITTSGTLSVSLTNQSANTVFAGPTTGSSAPSFRNLTIADIRSTVNQASFLANSSCSLGQALTYSSLYDTIQCTSDLTAASGTPLTLTAGPGGNNNIILQPTGTGLVTAKGSAVFTGNVGIGTSASATYALEVSGNIKASNISTSGKVGVGMDPSVPLDVNGIVRSSGGYALSGNGLASVIGAGLYSNAANTVSLATNSNERLRIDSAGYVGIGTTNPLTPLDVISTSSASSPRGITSTQYSSDPGAARVSGMKIRGSPGSPSSVLSGDGLASFNAFGYDGTSLMPNAPSASIVMAANGTFSSTSHPTKISFSTASSGSTTPLERVTIDSTGNVGIGSSAPSETLDLGGGNAKIGYQRTSGTCSVSAYGTLICHLPCTGNGYIVGGGCQPTTPVQTYGFPDNDTSWACYINNSGNSSGNTITVYTICLNVR